MSEMDAIDIYKWALNSVSPEILVPQFLKLEGKVLTVGDNQFELDEDQKIILIGVGKASASMAESAEKILKEKISEGIVITKYGHGLPLKYCRLIEAGHPVPDENSVNASNQLLEMIGGRSALDTIIFLLSGGASSLLTDLPPGISLEDIKVLNENLLRCGADIYETNTVRKHVSLIKGGKLSEKAFPAKVYTLILSDVPGDDPAVIASGPTVPDNTRAIDAYAILEKFQLTKNLPASILDWLRTGINEESGKEPHERNLGASNYKIIGSNSTAIQSATSKALQLGYHVEIIPGIMRGEARLKAKEFVKKLSEHQGPWPVCFLWGGETFVTVKADGKGGRCQEFALAAICELMQKNKIPTIVCAGTDGTDGDTSAAGAIVNKDIFENITRRNLDPFVFLDRNDSNTFFAECGGLIVTGPTRTNVMDIAIGILHGPV